MSIAIALHLVAAIVWVGGMLFAHVVLRPSAASLLEPPQRLQLWVRVFGRFFPWVWVAVIILPATGYWMVFEVLGGLSTVGLHIHLMQALGIPMILIFLHIWFAPWRRLRESVSIGDWPRAGAALNQIRTLVGINMTLGVLVAVVGSAGRYIHF